MKYDIIRCKTKGNSPIAFYGNPFQIEMIDWIGYYQGSCYLLQKGIHDKYDKLTDSAYNCLFL